MKVSILTIWGVVCISFLLGVPSNGRAADGCITSKCHAQVTQAKFLHDPVAAGECIDCHQASGGGKHPAGKGTFQLVAKGNALCNLCHAALTKGKKHVHSAVADGDCTDCHDPHGGANRFLLSTPGGALCLECHDGINKASHKHGPVASAHCLFCHDPHASNNMDQLKAAGNRVCFQCHGGIEKIIRTSKSEHPPVAEGHCWTCHNPHGSAYPYLLRRAFPTGMYAPFSVKSYALCFGCHNKDAILYKRTSEATGFRNGDRNLHYVHVDKSVKGRVCTVCHGIHGADQANLIHRHYKGFGDWNIPIDYKATATGGTCVVGCHQPRSYDRVRPVINP